MVGNDYGFQSPLVVPSLGTPARDATICSTGLRGLYDNLTNRKVPITRRSGFSSQTPSPQESTSSTFALSSMRFPHTPFQDTTERALRKDVARDFVRTRTTRTFIMNPNSGRNVH